jgi:hypothetical protein
MRRFSPLFVLVLLALLAPASGALAKSDNAGSNGEAGASESHAGSDNNDNGNNGNAGGNRGGGKPADTPGGGPPDKDQDAALDAVESGEAVPLENILSEVERNSGGEVLDAHQMLVRGFLLYEIKVLEPGGRVKDLYYYAKSGRPVGQ